MHKKHIFAIIKIVAAGMLSKVNFKKFDARVLAERKVFMRIINKIRGLSLLSKIIIGGAAFIIITVGLIIAVLVQGNLNKSADNSQTVQTEEQSNTEDATETEEAETEANSSDNEEIVMSTVNVFFNGAWLQPYSKEDVVKAKGINLEEISNDTNLLAQGVIGFNQEVSRVKIWFEDLNGRKLSDEFTLNGDNNWSTKLDLSSYEGEIIVAISISDKELPPSVSYSYFKLVLPN